MECWENGEETGKLGVWGAGVAGGKPVGEAMRQLVHPLALGVGGEEARQGMNIDRRGGQGLVWVVGVNAECGWVVHG